MLANHKYDSHFQCSHLYFNLFFCLDSRKAYTTLAVYLTLVLWVRKSFSFVFVCLFVYPATPWNASCLKARLLDSCVLPYLQGLEKCPMGRRCSVISLGYLKDRKLWVSGCAHSRAKRRGRNRAIQYIDSFQRHHKPTFPQTEATRSEGCHPIYDSVLTLTLNSDDFGQTLGLKSQPW